MCKRLVCEAGLASIQRAQQIPSEHHSRCVHPCFSALLRLLRQAALPKRAICAAKATRMAAQGDLCDKLIGRMRANGGMVELPPQEWMTDDVMDEFCVLRLDLTCRVLP